MGSPRGRSAGSNGTSGSRKPSGRVKNPVDYDEKRRFAELNEQIDGDDQAAIANANMSELDEHLNNLSESWETESLFADAIEDLAEDRFFTEGKAICFSHTVIGQLFFFFFDLCFGCPDIMTR